MADNAAAWFDAASASGDHPDLHHAIARSLPCRGPEGDEVTEQPKHVNAEADPFQNRLQLLREMEDRGDQCDRGSYDHRRDVDHEEIHDERHRPGGEPNIPWRIIGRCLGARFARRRRCGGGRHVAAPESRAFSGDRGWIARRALCSSQSSALRERPRSTVPS